MTKISVADRWAIVTWQREGLGARKIQWKMKTELQKQYSLAGIHYVMKKYASSAEVSDRKRIRTKTARNQQNIEAVKNEMRKKTRNASPVRTPFRLAKKMNISRSSVSRILKLDLGAKPYKVQVVHKLNERNKGDRLERCKWLLRHYKEEDVQDIVFTDESVFPLSGYHNSQNMRVYAEKKGDLDQSQLLKEKQQFPRSVMVWAGVSARGKLPVIICEEGCKVNAKNYQEEILKKMVPKANRLHKGKWVLQQDSAPSHRSSSTQRYLKEKVPRFIPANKWPPCSPDLNPLDYSVWGLLKQRVYSRHLSTIEELGSVIQEEFNALDQAHITNAIQQWRKRLRLVVQHQGGHIEHLLKKL